MLRMVDIVALDYGVGRADILSSYRGETVVQARMVAMTVVWLEFHDMSLPKIGQLFGGKHHTTVLNAIRKTGAWPNRKSWPKPYRKIRNAIHGEEM